MVAITRDGITGAHHGRKDSDVYAVPFVRSIAIEIWYDRNFHTTKDVGNASVGLHHRAENYLKM
jgi:hypothetical protein